MSDRDNTTAEPIFAVSEAAVSRTTDETLMRQAAYQLNHGEGVSARAVFEILAGHGSHRGALALAETYDPDVQAHHADWGLNADVRLARQWYKRASELGSLSAYERLKAMDAARL